MAPSNSRVSSLLRQLIHYHIENNLLKNALFFAERLIVFDQRSPESAYLLALCHLRLGDNASVYEYSKPAGSRGSHLGCAYVFAQACLNLKRYKEGINALEKSRVIWSEKNSFGKHSMSSHQPLADAAAVNCLLGKLYSAWDNKSKAVNCFEDALKLNPFIWDAFTSLCDMGVNVRVPNIFKINSGMEKLLGLCPQESGEKQPQRKSSHHSSAVNQERRKNTNCSNSNMNDRSDPFNNAPSQGLHGGLFGSSDIPQKLSESSPSLTNLPAMGGVAPYYEALETPESSSSAGAASLRSRRDLSSHYLLEPPQAPLRKTRAITGLDIDLNIDVPKISRGLTKKLQRIQDPAGETTATHALKLSSSTTTSACERKRTVSGQTIPRNGLEDLGVPHRRSVRLFQKQPTSNKPPSSNIPVAGPPLARELKKAKPPIPKIIRSGSSSTAFGCQVSGSSKQHDDGMDLDQQESLTKSWTNTLANATHKITEPEPSKDEEAVKALLDLLKKIGNGYYALARFQCSEALQIYSSLPKVHRDTPWIMAQVGRAYYEQAAYSEAEKLYRRIRQAAPMRLEDMEIYSTILWHLKRETDLAFLAHELIDASWQSPQAWCALGNSWSLARDHEQALRCFKRATQLNPKFAYAFTLQGHEHVANEEYDKALVSYRLGMAADKRHYNAWYGVGRVYEKLGNYEKAFVHFSAASSINPTNAVLICCIGTVLEKQKQPRQALQYFSRATELAPRSALTRFKKARTLMSVMDYKGAHDELMILKDIAPEEAMVHFLLGKLYKCLKEKGLAVRHFTIALNLDPKASQQIKEAIESIEDENEDEESLMS
ncbi:hypothetical protein K3495_g4410 [Podosphaera aphanis]|nr:hypothetical protein K3495_g4410 [Podosphaera aphanis]